MTSARPSLGIYGPYGPDRSGIARYIEASTCHLQNEYRITVISNATEWLDPYAFDATLYHLGNNRMHHSAFEAARLKPGVALIHEYLHVDYYYQTCDLIDPDLQVEILADLTKATGVPAATLDEFLDRCKRSGAIDPYAIDIGIEKYAVRNSAVSAVHSQGVADMLEARYPDAAVQVVPFPVEPWPVHHNDNHLQYYGIPDGSFTFGSFGFIGEYKKVPWILAAWRRWHDRPSDARLLLVGERQIEVDADTDAVIELGYVDDSEFMRLLASVDCGIQLREPSLGETSGPTASLAAHGRPTIVSDIPEMKLLGQGRRMMYLKSDSDVIENLIIAMRAQYALGREPHSVFDARFSWDGWADVMLKLLAVDR